MTLGTISFIVGWIEMLAMVRVGAALLGAGTFVRGAVLFVVIPCTRGVGDGTNTD